MRKEVQNNSGCNPKLLAQKERIGELVQALAVGDEDQFVYTAAGNRKKALEMVQTGLKLLPEHESLREVRRTLGVRSRPAVPFLDRSHPINVTLGQARHAKKLADREPRPRRKK